MTSAASKIFSAQTNASANSAAIDASKLYSVSMMAIFTDAVAAGTLQMQASNDFSPSGVLPTNWTPTNWVNIPGTTFTGAVTTGGAVLLAGGQINFKWVRLSWTKSAGAGTFDVNMNIQGF
jgi:hypothetical protein